MSPAPMPQVLRRACGGHDGDGPQRSQKKGRIVEHSEWMNEQVREEIESLQHTHGLEEEALALWHLSKLGRLLNDMRDTDLEEDLSPFEGRVDKMTEQQTVFFLRTTEWYTNVYQHFTALRRALGERVLQRNFPDGWGSKYRPQDEED